MSEDERYTTEDTITEIKRVAAAPWFDLDAAACEESHHAAKWYDKENSGLSRPWFGHVYVNPPYSDIEPWVRCAWNQWSRSEVLSITMLVPATRCEQPWWQNLVEPHRDRPASPLVTKFLPGRVKFSAPGLNGEPIKGSPRFGCVLLMWRSK